MEIEEKTPLSDVDVEVNFRLEDRVLMARTITIQKNLISVISAENEKLLESVRDAGGTITELTSRLRAVSDNRDHLAHVNNTNFQQYTRHVSWVEFKATMWMVIAILELGLVAALVWKFS